MQAPLATGLGTTGVDDDLDVSDAAAAAKKRPDDHMSNTFCARERASQNALLL